MNRLNLNQLVEFFIAKNMVATADFFRSCKNDSVVEEGWIEEEFVKRHISVLDDTMTPRLDETMWRNIKCNVTTAMVLERLN
jgi:hypothetical protein